MLPPYKLKLPSIVNLKAMFGFKTAKLKVIDLKMLLWYDTPNLKAIGVNQKKVTE